ncbi:hypothetical protein MCAMS1_01317 [biofilm metagenome]
MTLGSNNRWIRSCCSDSGILVCTLSFRVYSSPTNFTSRVRFLARRIQSASSVTRLNCSGKLPCSQDQRFFPHNCVQSSSASIESQAGTWTPLVTWETDVSYFDQLGNSGLKIRLLTVPCNWLTPLILALPLIAR